MIQEKKSRKFDTRNTGRRPTASTRGIEKRFPTPRKRLG
jgi:hypothetical protein